RRGGPGRGCAWSAATASTDPSTGPMHGVQPNANAAPATGAAHTPYRLISGWKRNSRPSSHGTGSVLASSASASRMTSPPLTRVTGTWLRSNTDPSAVADRPSTTNTTEKPATNRAPPRTAVAVGRPPGFAGGPSGSDAASAVGRGCADMPSPVVSDRYAGTTGSTHGDSSETVPPANATAKALADIATAHLYRARVCPIQIGTGKRPAPLTPVAAADSRSRRQRPRDYRARTHHTNGGTMAGASQEDAQVFAEEFLSFLRWVHT